MQFLRAALSPDNRFLFFLARLPETRGRSLEDIAAELGSDDAGAGPDREPDAHAAASRS